MDLLRIFLTIIRMWIAVMIGLNSLDLTGDNMNVKVYIDTIY